MNTRHTKASIAVLTIVLMLSTVSAQDTGTYKQLNQEWSTSVDGTLGLPSTSYDNGLVGLTLRGSYLFDSAGSVLDNGSTTTIQTPVDGGVYFYRKSDGFLRFSTDSDLSTASTVQVARPIGSIREVTYQGVDMALTINQSSDMTQYGFNLINAGNLVEYQPFGPNKPIGVGYIYEGQYIAPTSGGMVVLNASNGNTIRTDAYSGFAGSDVVDGYNTRVGDSIYQVTTNDTILEYDMETGTFSNVTGLSAESVYESEDGYLFYVNTTGVLKGYNLSTGETNYYADRTFPQGNSVGVYDSGTSRLYAMDADANMTYGYSVPALDTSTNGGGSDNDTTNDTDGTTDSNTDSTSGWDVLNTLIPTLIGIGLLFIFITEVEKANEE